jgi:hypothetical protein
MTAPLDTETVLANARAVGWAITPERAAQIVTTAAPTLAAFQATRGTVAFDHDAASFASMLATHAAQPNDDANNQ